MRTHDWLITFEVNEQSVLLILCSHQAKVNDQSIGVMQNDCPLRELFIKEFEWHLKRGFTMLIVTKAGRVREWLHLTSLSSSLNFSFPFNYVFSMFLLENTYNWNKEKKSCSKVRNRPKDIVLSTSLLRWILKLHGSLSRLKCTNVIR